MCAGVRGFACAGGCWWASGRAGERAGMRRCGRVGVGVGGCMGVGAGVHGCARVCAGMCVCVYIHESAGEWVGGYVRVCTWVCDEFSE